MYYGNQYCVDLNNFGIFYSSRWGLWHETEMITIDEILITKMHQKLLCIMALLWHRPQYPQYFPDLTLLSFLRGRCSISLQEYVLGLDDFSTIALRIPSAAWYRNHDIPTSIWIVACRRYSMELRPIEFSSSFYIPKAHNISFDHAGERISCGFQWIQIGCLICSK